VSVSQVELKQIFPTVVMRGNIDREFTEDEKNVIRGHADNVRANGGCHQSIDSYVLNNPVMADVKRACEEFTQAYVDKVIRPANELRPYITQSWITYYNKGDYITPHHHANSILSGVLYFQAEDNVDSMTFIDTRYRPILIASSEYDELNSDSWVFSIKTGTIMIFPSDAVHRVTQVQSERTRICLAFNTYCDGLFGTEVYRTELKLKNEAYK
jgi:uncharacterized protein (TIGR02466 family)